MEWRGWPLAYFSEPITPADVERFGIKIGDCASQALLENLAMLIGVRLWLPQWKDERIVVRVRTDSMAAVGAWEKERSTTPAINAIVREMALDVAEAKYKLDIVEHLPGRHNDWADRLSRLMEPGGAKRIPHELTLARRDVPPARLAEWWRAAVLPSV